MSVVVVVAALRSELRDLGEELNLAVKAEKTAQRSFVQVAANLDRKRAHVTNVQTRIGQIEMALEALGVTPSTPHGGLV